MFLFFKISLSFLGLYFALSPWDASACPVCTATMVLSFVVGEVLNIDIIFIAFLISGIVVSSTDWIAGLYDKKIYYNFLNKIEQLQESAVGKKRLQLVKILRFKFKVSRYIVFFGLYLINYYGVFIIAHEKQSVVDDGILFYKGLVFGFLFSQASILFSNFILRTKKKRIVRFQKTIFLLSSFALFIILYKIITFIK